MIPAGSSVRGRGSGGFERYHEQDNAISDLIQGGCTIATVLWWLAFQQNPNEVSYVVKDLTRGHTRVPIANACEMAKWEPPLPALNHEDAFHGHIEKVYDAEDAITANTDGGELICIYNLTSRPLVY